jgi:tRNA threonylcarbamoyl adenosine modification protein YeaZ
MLILILETSSEKGCLIVADNETPLDVQFLAGGPELSKTIALRVKNILNGRKADLIAVGAGPGSYTGIRVGAALAKGLSYGWGVPLIGFCSLEAFGPRPVLVDARGGGFYALFDETPCLIQPEDPLLQNLPLISSPHPHLIQKRLQTGAIFKETGPDPKSLSQLVYRQFLEEGTPPLKLHYVSVP